MFLTHGANVLSFAALTNSYHAVICAEQPTFMWMNAALRRS